MKKLLVLSVLFFLSCNKKDNQISKQTCQELCQNTLSSVQTETKGKYLFFTSNSANTTSVLLFYGKDTLVPFPKEMFIRFNPYPPSTDDSLFSKFSNIDTCAGIYYIEVININSTKSKGIKPILVENGKIKYYDVH